MRRAPGLAFALLTVTLAAWPTSARAEPAPSLDLRGMEVTTHPEGLTRLEPATTPGFGEWNLGAFASYAYRPVVVSRDGDVPSYDALRHQLALDWVGSVGLGERLGLGLVVPTILYQRGEAPPPGSGASEPATVAFGNLAVDGRATLLEQGAFGGLGLAAAVRVSVPTGARRAYVAENQVRVETRLLGELGVLGSSLRASVGARLRAADERFEGRQFGDDLPWGLGLVVKPQAFGLDREGRYLFSLDGHGAVALTPRFGDKRQTPAALGLRGRRAFGDAHLTLGVELPLDSAPGVPRVRVLASVGWAPRVRDADQDGIADEVDQCQELAEDHDGFEDGDGCPDFDNDGDGVPDTEDRCAKTLEDFDEYLDEDGCADPDNDGDGILDTEDACPREPGVKDADPKLNGCAVHDADKDGIVDARDRCPRRAEDRDGWEDEDGCPEWDNDGDGIHDREDACKNERGPRRSDPELNGCPSPDRDGDTLEGDADRCPDAPETWNGVEDGDGCPEKEGILPHKTLALLEPARGTGRPRFVLKLGAPVTFTTDGALSPETVPVARAIATLLNGDPQKVLMVAVRPARARADAEQAALTRAFTLVLALRAYTHRDEAAEVIGWKAVEKLPGATLPSGLGFLMLAPLAPAAATSATPQTGPVVLPTAPPTPTLPGAPLPTTTPSPAMPAAPSATPPAAPSATPSTPRAAPSATPAAPSATPPAAPQAPR